MSKIRTFADDVLRFVGIGGILYSLGGGIVIAIARAYWPRIADPVLYGLIGVVLILFFVAILKLVATIKRMEGAVCQEEITPENVERHLRLWTDNFGLGFQRLPEKDTPEAHFAARITLQNDTHVIVFRPKERPKYLMVQAGISPSAEHQAMLNGLSPTISRYLPKG